MKRFLAGIAALGFLAIAVPAVAQDRHDDHDRGRQQSFHHGPPPRYYGPPPRHYAYREGQAWNGHRLHNRGGHWGYYQPRNGAQIFISIPL